MLVSKKKISYGLVKDDIEITYPEFIGFFFPCLRKAFEEGRLDIHWHLHLKEYYTKNGNYRIMLICGQHDKVFEYAHKECINSLLIQYMPFLSAIIKGIDDKKLSHRILDRVSEILIKNCRTASMWVPQELIDYYCFLHL